MRPVEGTILTVVREIAEAVEALDGDRRSSRCSNAAPTPRATRSSARPSCFPVLREAGVVDAGGKGFTLLLDALLEVVDGRPIPEPEVVATPAAVAAHLAGDDDVSGLRYEVMYLLDAPDATMPGVPRRVERDRRLDRRGRRRRHLELPHPHQRHRRRGRGRHRRGPAAQDPRHRPDRAGRRGAVGARGRRRSPTSTSSPTQPVVTTAVVAVGVGEGIRRLLTSLGVQQVVAGGQSMNPSTAQILEAVEACAADCGDRAAEQQEHRRRSPARSTRSPRSTSRSSRRTSVPEALAALVEYDPNADARRERGDDDRRRASACAPARSPRRCATPWSTSAQVREGDWIALVARRHRRDRRARRPTRCASCSASSSTTTARSSPCSSAPTPPPTTPSGSASTSRSTFPHLEVEFHDGGQPLYPYLVGVE